MYGTWEHEAALVALEARVEREGAYMPVDPASLGGDLFDYDDAPAAPMTDEERAALEAEIAAIAF